MQVSAVSFQESGGQDSVGGLTRIIREAFTAAAYLGTSAAFRSLGLLNVL